MKKSLKKTAKMMLVAILSFLMFFHTVFADTSGENLGNLSIQNAGFENSDATWTGGSRTTEKKRSGSYSRKVMAGQQLSQVITLSSEQKSSMIAFGAYIQTENMEEDGYIYISIGERASTSDSWSNTQKQCFYGNHNEDWYQLQAAIHLKSSTTQVKLMITNLNTSGTLYVDDFYAYRCSESSESVSEAETNWDFEQVAGNTPIGWQLSGYGQSYVEGSLEIPKMVTDTSNYHSGSHSLHFAKQSIDRETMIVSMIPFQVNELEYLEYTWGMWIKSKNSNSMIRLDLDVYDESGSKIQTITGNTTLLSRSDKLSEWQYVSTTGQLPTNAVTACYRIVVTDGKTDVYIDDLFCMPTETTSEKLVDWCDFHSVTEAGQMNGVWSRTVETLFPGYSYEVSVNYTATSEGELKVQFWDLQNQLLEEKSLLLPQTAESISMPLNVVVPEGTYNTGVSVGGNCTLQNYAIVETGTPKGNGDWTASWVWYPEDATNHSNQMRFFRYHFQVEQDATVEQGYLQLAIDDALRTNLYLDGSALGSSTYTTHTETDKKSVRVYQLPKQKLTAGEHVIAFAVSNASSYAGVVFEGEIQYADKDEATLLASGITGSTYVSRLGNVTPLTDYSAYLSSVSGTGWESVSYDYPEEDAWVEAKVLGVPPSGNLGQVAYSYQYADRLNITTDISASDVQDANAGEKIAVSTQVTFEDTERKPSETSWTKEVVGELCVDGGVIAHLPVQISYADDSRTALRFEFEVPDYLSTGTYAMQFSKREVGITNSEDNTLINLQINSLEKSLLNAEVRSAELYLNEEKTSPVLYLRPPARDDYDYDTLSKMKNSGIGLYGTYNGSMKGSDGYPIWTGTDIAGNPEIDYDAFDYEIYRTLDLNPNAYILVHLNMDAPQWWLEEHPEECIEYSTSYGNGTQVSMASELYQEEAEQVIHALTEHMAKAGYGHRVFGVRISAGNTAEWMHYSTQDGTDAEQTAFRAYLKEIYNNVSALQTAWNNSTVTFETAEVPSVERRKDSSNIALLNPSTHRDVIDYNKYLGWIGAKRLLGYADTVKSVCSNWIVGAYNGYLWYHTSSAGIGSAHTSVSKLLESPSIDFISAPAAYGERLSGYSTGYMGMSDSIMAHGKLYLIEQDNRTLRNGFVGNASSDNSRGFCETVKESVQQLTRDLTFDYVRGSGFWLYDMQGGWFDDESIYARVKSIKEEYDKQADIGSNNEVAVFVGEESYDYLAGDSLSTKGVSDTQYLMNALYKEQRRELSAIGTSYDTYTIEDLCDGIVTQEYKVNIVLSPFELSDSQRAAIDAKLKKDKKTILWVYMPGASDGSGVYEADHIASLTGIQVALENAKRPLQAETTTGIVYGSANPATGPYICVTDSNVSVLANYANGDVAAAYKTMGTGSASYTSVYSAVPDVPAELLRDICEKAGVHLYSEDMSDVVEHNNQYVSVHSAIGGSKKLTLPLADRAGNRLIYTVEDVFGNATELSEISANGEFAYTIEAGDTVLFRLNKSTDGKIWNGGMLENGDMNLWNEETGLPLGYESHNSGDIMLALDDEKGTVAKLTGQSIALSKQVELQAGKTYVISFMYRYLEGTGYPILQLYHVNPSQKLGDYYPAKGSGTWQRYSLHYTPETDMTIDMRIRVNGTAADSVMHVTELYLDEYKGGLLQNGDFRLNKNGASDLDKWNFAGNHTYAYDENDGNYWLTLKGSGGPWIEDTVTLEKNATYLARFTAKTIGAGTASFRMYDVIDGVKEASTNYVKALPQDTENTYSFLIQPGEELTKKYHFVLAGGDDDSMFSVTNASLIKNIGDVNENGVADAEDAEVLRAQFIEDGAVDEFFELTADGKVNSCDLVRICKYRTN